MFVFGGKRAKHGKRVDQQLFIRLFQAAPIGRKFEHLKEAAQHFEKTGTVEIAVFFGGTLIAFKAVPFHLCAQVRRKPFDLMAQAKP